MGANARYSTKRVTLETVLDTLDEKLHIMTRSVFRRREANEDELLNLVGRVQGMEEAIKTLEYHLGDRGVPE